MAKNKSLVSTLFIYNKICLIWALASKTQKLDQNRASPGRELWAIALAHMAGKTPRRRLPNVLLEVVTWGGAHIPLVTPSGDVPITTKYTTSRWPTLLQSNSTEKCLHCSMCFCPTSKYRTRWQFLTSFI